MWALLNHPEPNGTGFDRPAGLNIILDLHKLWDTNPRVSQFIIATEEAQKNLMRPKLPILGNMLVVFTTSMLLWADSFSRNHPCLGP